MALLASAAGLSTAQDRLKTYPGYEQFQKMSKEMQGAVVKSGALQVKWADDGKSFTYSRTASPGNTTWPPGKPVETCAAPSQPEGSGGRRAAGPARWSSTTAASPDKKLKAFYRDRNVWLSDAGGKNAAAVTTEGNEGWRQGRFGQLGLRRGAVSELRPTRRGRRTAKKPAYYRFDDSRSPITSCRWTRRSSTPAGYRSLSKGRTAQPDRRSLRL